MNNYNILKQSLINHAKNYGFIYTTLPYHEVYNNIASTLQFHYSGNKEEVYKQIYDRLIYEFALKCLSDIEVKELVNKFYQEKISNKEYLLSIKQTFNFNYSMLNKYYYSEQIYDINFNNKKYTNIESMIESHNNYFIVDLNKELKYGGIYTSPDYSIKYILNHLDEYFNFKKYYFHNLSNFLICCDIYKEFNKYIQQTI